MSLAIVFRLATTAANIVIENPLDFVRQLLSAFEELISGVHQVRELSQRPLGSLIRLELYPHFTLLQWLIDIYGVLQDHLLDPGAQIRHCWCCVPQLSPSALYIHKASCT